jgi:hypothetical protein
MQAAATGRELHTANDMAAVLDWRLPEPAPTDPGPLPWLPGIPSTLHDHHVWGEYLAKRSQLVVGLANQVRDCASQKANSRYGHRRAATRASPSSPKSQSGAPPSASTPKTADQPEQDSYKRRPPFVNRTSTETLPCAATALAQM